MTIPAHHLTAFNTATASDNKIHADDIAARFGFTGGLVPGVDVFAYMAHVPLSVWGRVWLTEGAMQARFLKPVYDGDVVAAQGDTKPFDDIAFVDDMTLSVTARGETCATGIAARFDAHPPPALAPYRDLPDPSARPKASPASLKIGSPLGRTLETYRTEDGLQHLRDVREDAILFDDGRIANPAWLLRRANYILAANVMLGPWIHTESRIRLHGLLTDGEPCETRAVVAETIEKGGHGIVALDVTISADDRLVMSGRHWAIYEPRQVRAAAQP